MPAFNYLFAALLAYGAGEAYKRGRPEFAIFLALFCLITCAEGIALRIAQHKTEAPNAPQA